MPAALIFDIDGTLLDSVDLHARAWQEAFHLFGSDIPFEDVRYQIGKGGDQLLPVFLNETQIKEFGKELEEFRGKLFKEKYLQQVRPFPKVRELFEAVLARGQKTALASSAKGDELGTYEHIARIDDLVQVETSSADAEKSKPHPDIFEAALDRIRQENGGKAIPPDQVLVIGDSPHDMEAAKRAGLRSVGVRCGGFPEADLTAAGALAIYDGPADLLEHYDSSPLAVKAAARFA